jgi:hypothetical protein
MLIEGLCSLQTSDADHYLILNGNGYALEALIASPLLA